MRGRAGSHDPADVNIFEVGVGLARFHNLNFIKIFAVKEMGAREKFLELQVPGVTTIST